MRKTQRPLTGSTFSGFSLFINRSPTNLQEPPTLLTLQVSLKPQLTGFCWLEAVQAVVILWGNRC